MSHNERLITDFKEFLERENKSANTIKSYISEVKLFLKWLEETEGREIKIDEVFTGDIKSYKEYLLSRRKTPNTINKKIESLRSFFDAFLGKHIVSLPKVKQQGNTVKWLSRNEKNALLRVVNREDLFKGDFLGFRNRAIIYTFLLSGLRLNELINLRWEDWKNGYIEVMGKGGKYRRVETNSELRKIFAEMKEKQQEKGIQSDYIFCTTKGKPLQVPTLEDIFKKINKQLDFKVTPHMLRHTFAHDLVQKGVRIDLVADILGHSQLETTRIYTTPSAEERRKAVESLELGI